VSVRLLSSLLLTLLNSDFNELTSAFNDTIWLTAWFTIFVWALVAPSCTAALFLLFSETLLSRDSNSLSSLTVSSTC
jgi:hypothetical protein